MKLVKRCIFSSMSVALALVCSAQYCPIPVNPCGQCDYFLGTPTGFVCYNREYENEFFGCCEYEIAWVQCVPTYPYSCYNDYQYHEWHRYLGSYSNDWYCFGASPAGGVGHWGPGECEYSPL